MIIPALKKPQIKRETRMFKNNIIRTRMEPSVLWEQGREGPNPHGGAQRNFSGEVLPALRLNR